MAAYYYLVAQLPSLALNEAPPAPADAVADLAGRLMAAHDAALINSCRLDPPASGGVDGGVSTGSRVIDGFVAWETALRRHLAKARAGRLERDAAHYPEGSPIPSSAAAAARAALAADSPLEAEFVLIEARWNALEDFLGVDSFSREVIFAYLLKTRLLERRARFDTEAGFAVYQAAYADVLGTAQTSISPGEPV